MVSSSIAFYTLSTLALYSSAFAQADFAPCPILGPRYPQPSQVTDSPYVQEALQNLTAASNELVQSGGNSSYTKATPNTTTFSIALFDSVDITDVHIPFIYEYHHSAPSFDNKTSVDADSVYNIGGLSQFRTVYTFLAATQDNLWYDPITKYLPGLNGTSGRSAAAGTDWNHVLLVDLATQLVGIPREGSCLHPASTQPSTTPIYSDAAFCLLALALEKITGKSFADTVQESILSPLNISATTVGTPASDTNAVIPDNVTTSGWQIPTTDSALLAATGLFSTITDLSIIGRSILRSSLLPMPTTNRWLKPHSYTSNPRNGVGMPFDIYTPTLTGTVVGPITEIFTKLGPNGLYSPYFGLVPDYGVGFVVLSADTNQAADLNAYADLIAEYLLPTMEQTAAAEATIKYAGDYTSRDGA
ncbi:hypothetical protein LTR70_004281 [Exophiala xenobiotica]|uniref:Beta-lactamase-related domain-containing protein n=1 Tax=Lithohypha guttulata TaxID=1690604 RepID=A0ABR0KEE4_9EURO|nr:hypothetical protein LTR24_003752 [Lithohypha guttulata]KAK5321036.1 hypothetical protein LTR70_004281 [Exophiala xenobiotica]